MNLTIQTILTLIICLSAKLAGIAQHTVPAEHPRIWLTPEWKAVLQEKKDQNTAEWQAFIGMANSYLNQDVTNGHIHYALVEALAYQVTGDVQYAKRANYFLEQSSPEDLDPGNANDYRWNAMQPVVVFDWIYDYLEAENLAQRYVDLFHEWSDHNFTHQPRYGDTDHLISVARNMALASIATWYEDATDAPQYFDYALNTLWFGDEGIHDFVVTDLSKGGVFHEGIFYSDGTLNYLYEFGEAVRSARGIDIWEGTNFPQSHIRATIHLLAPDKTWFVYGDVENSNDFDNYTTPSYYRNILKAIKASKGTPEAAWGKQLLTMLDEPGKFSAFEKFLWSEPSVDAEDYKPHLGENFYSEGMGTVISRSDWTEEATYMAFQCKGAEADHMHDDALSFNIQRKGVWVTKEASGYYGTKRSDFHNTLLIENFERNGSASDERDIGSQNPRGFEEDGSILKLAMEENFVYIKADATGLYNGDPDQWATDQSCQKAVRSFLYIKPDFFIVYDDTETKEASGERWKKYVFHTQHEPVVSGNTISDTYEGQKVVSTTLLPQDYTFTVNDMAVKYGDHEAWSIPLDQRNWQVHVQSQDTDFAEQFLHVITTGDAGAELPESKYVTSEDEQMVGAIVMAAEPQVVLFAKNSSHIISADVHYSANYSGSGQHFLGDLEPEVAYNVRKDGEALTTLTSDSNGMIRFSSSGGGDFVISASDGDTLEMPMAGFTYDTTSWCSKKQIRFTNTSTGGEPLAYSWSFSNATPDTSSEADPVVTATGSGTVTATLQVTNAAGSDEHSVVIEPVTCDCGGDHSTTYYVSETGSDSNDGLTPESAFATLAHAESVVSAGDVVRVADGSYDGFYADVSGTSDKPIVFMADGDEVFIVSDNGITPDGINVENASWIVIDGFNVNNRTRAGIRVALSDNVTLRNNRCFYNGRWGIFTGFAENIVIENNECAYSGIEHGIYHSNSADNPVIRYNTCHHNNANGIHLNGDASQGGDGMISNARIYGNIIYENGTAGGSGINCDGVNNSQIYNNLLYGNHASGISLYRIDGAAGSSNNKIYNNTVINASDARWCLNIRNNSNSNEVFNNILINKHSWRGSINLDPSISSLFSDYNLVTNRFTTNDASSVIGLDQWHSLGRGANSIPAGDMADIFMDPAADDFSLNPGSTAIDAGTDAVSDVVTLDIEKNVRPVNHGYDIGCYEYQQQVAAGLKDNVIREGAKKAEIIVTNPSERLEAVVIKLPHKEMVSFRLLNSEGIEIASVHERLLEKGQHRIAFNRPITSSGLYLLVYKTGDQLHMIRIILL